MTTNIQKIRAEAPLVHNITNYVVMNWTANALLAIGASPVMAHAVEEAEEMTTLARALVVNIGTLSAHWIRAMELSMEAAKRASRPIVFDPVGAGATKFRTETCLRLISDTTPTIIRGNPSEIAALAGASRGGGTKGVDSTMSSDAGLESAIALSSKLRSIVCMSGKTDYVVSDGKIVRIENGDNIMSQVTGMGCVASALIGAFASVDSSPLQATVNAMAVMGVAGEIAAKLSDGPGSFQVKFLDALYSLDDAKVATHRKVFSV